MAEVLRVVVSGGREIAVPFLHFEELSSTNDYLKTQADSWRDDAVVVCAETQTSGRGQFDRVWVDSRGNDLLFSILIHPRIAIAKTPYITIMTAQVLVEVLRARYNFPCTIKRPNDIMCDNRKMAGILTEQISQGADVQSVVVGVGLNCNTPADALFSGSTSLAQECGDVIDRQPLLQSIVQSFFSAYEQFLIKNGGSDASFMR